MFVLAASDSRCTASSLERPDIVNTIKARQIGHRKGRSWIALPKATNAKSESLTGIRKQPNVALVPDLSQGSGSAMQLGCSC